MKTKGKVLMGILVLILVVILVVVVVNNKNQSEEKKGSSEKVQQNSQNNNVEMLDNGTKLNTSSELSKTKTVEGLEISNIELKENGGISTLTADVKNTTKQDKESTKIKIEILDQTGKVLLTLKDSIKPVKAGETVKFSVAVTADVTNAYDFKITKE